jgi:hypothetical protein
MTETINGPRGLMISNALAELLERHMKPEAAQLVLQAKIETVQKSRGPISRGSDGLRGSEAFNPRYYVPDLEGCEARLVGLMLKNRVAATADNIGSLRPEHFRNIHLKNAFRNLTQIAPRTADLDEIKFKASMPQAFYQICSYLADHAPRVDDVGSELKILVTQVRGRNEPISTPSPPPPSPPPPSQPCEAATKPPPWTDRKEFVVYKFKFLARLAADPAHCSALPIAVILVDRYLHYEDDGHRNMVWPDRKKLAVEIRRDVKTVDRQLRTLVKGGYLRVALPPSRNQRTHYETVP